MRLLRAILQKEGWHVSGDDLPIQIGVKFGGSSQVNPHFHRSMHEYFLVLKGHIVVSVNGEQVTLQKGDLLVVEPNEHHEMITKSVDSQYLLLMPKAIPNDRVNLE